MSASPHLSTDPRPATDPRPQGAPAPRAVAWRTRGHRGGFITRLMSPGDLGRQAKPFVFLDLFEGRLGPGAMPPLDTGWHPHSGIATVTVVLDGAARYAETTGRQGAVAAGGVEWMRAGGGVWHTGSAEPGYVAGFQLWVALPPELENAPSESRYLSPDEVPVVGPARVVLGTYEGATSPLNAPPMTYLSVGLRDGERWTFTPPPGQDVAWLAVMSGALRVPARVSAGELVGFERGGGALELVADGDVRFVLGAAAVHPYELTLGDYSVHTSPEALARGEAEIRRLGRALRAEGKRSYALQRYG